MNDWLLWILGTVAGIGVLFLGAWLVRCGLDFFDEYTGREQWRR